MEGNLKQKKVTCGLDARLYVVGGGGTTHVWGCLVFLNRMRSGCAEFATLRVVRVYVNSDCANALHRFYSTKSYAINNYTAFIFICINH